MIITEEILYKNLNCDILKKSMVVYKVSNIIDGKIYVGKTTRNLRKRIMDNGINLSDTVIKANWMDITAMSKEKSLAS